MKAEKICFVGAHSGGHIVPCLTLAEKLRTNRQVTILFFTSTKPLDRFMVQNSAAVDYHFQLPIAQRHEWNQLLFVALGLFYSFFYSFFQLLLFMPDRIISTGSIAAIPVCISGYLLGIPIELIELNVLPGKTVRLLSHCADTLKICFKKTAQYLSHTNCIEQTYPIRFSLNHSRPHYLKSFEKDRITLFVQGGSQGSQAINTALRKAVEQNTHLQSRIQIIHQTGETQFNWKQQYANLGIPAHLVSFEPDLASYYQAADIVICRSGAGALFETLFFKKKCLTMPLETTANNHQVHNALAMAQEHPDLFTVVRTEQELISALSALCTRDNSVSDSRSLYK